MGRVGKSCRNGPVIGHRLEEREVAVVGVGELLLEAFELVGDVGQVAHDLQDALARRPEELLDARPRLQIEDAEVERGDRFFLQLEGVVVRLLEVLPRDGLVGLVKLLDDLCARRR